MKTAQYPIVVWVNVLILTMPLERDILFTLLFNLLLLGKETPKQKPLHSITGRFLVKSQRCFGILTFFYFGKNKAKL